MQSDATTLAEAIGSGKLTASEAMSASLSKLDEFSSLGAVCYQDPEKGLQDAAHFDAYFKISPGEKTPIFGGVPTLVKDLGGPFSGFPVRAGSHVLADIDGDDGDSDLAIRFRQTGLCVFGLTTGPEFGLSLASEPSLGPVCRNPLNSNLSAGGSSGGAACAVAAGIVSIAHATDAGGSIRVPAACCGLVGLKPSRGAIPSGPSFGNHLGGIASELAVCRSVRDTAAIFSAIAGEVKGPYPSTHFSAIKDKKLRVGLLTETGMKHPTTQERMLAVEAAAKSLEADGHSIVHLDGSRFTHMVDVSARVFASIININLAELAKTSGLDFSRSEPITQAAIERGHTMNGTTLWGLLNEMVLVSRDLWQLFETVDCLITPMLSCAPKPIGSFPTNHRDIDLHYDRMAAFSPLATLANISGFPAITMPFGSDDYNLPLPIQIMAPMGCEKLLLLLAGRLETELRWQYRFSIAGLDFR
jgi:amidase